MVSFIVLKSFVCMHVNVGCDEQGLSSSIGCELSKGKVEALSFLLIIVFLMLILLTIIYALNKYLQNDW